MLQNNKINYNDQDEKNNIKTFSTIKKANLPNVLKNKVSNIRTNLLVFVDTELNEMRRNCPTKVNSKSVKEIEMEHNSFNNKIILKTETYSTHCFLKNVDEYNSPTMQNGTNLRLIEENSLKFYKCPATIIQTHKGNKRIFHDDNFNEEYKKRMSLMTFKEILFLKQILVKDGKDDHKGKYEIQKYKINIEKTPSFNYMFHKANSLKLKSKSIRLNDTDHKNQVQKSFMYLRNLVFLIKNPLDTEKIKSDKLVLKKIDLFEFKKSLQINENQNNKNLEKRNTIRLNSLKLTGQNMSLGKSQFRSKIKKHTVNFTIPPINKNCVEESKKFFFGAG